jgi:predicted DNA-binding protein (UPF0251 family)
MPRPIKCRRVGFEPNVTYFKPAGVPMRELTEVTLTVEELEALKLKDSKGMSETSAAKTMDISQPTFNRLINSAHKKVAEALSKGTAIKIEGGTYKLKI